jgi:hypothetical protein
MLRLISLPFCRVVMAAPWDEPPARRFVAYRCRGEFRRLLGYGVIDEFATLSSPIFLGPQALAGKLYDTGIVLAHRRDAEMALDTGWPPLVVGLERFPAADELPATWQEDLLAAIAADAEQDAPPPADAIARRRVGSFQLERFAVGEAVVWATDAPLLPRQLGRLCEACAQPFVLALAMKRLARLDGDTTRDVDAVSERLLAELVGAARQEELGAPAPPQAAGSAAPEHRR